MENRVAFNKKCAKHCVYYPAAFFTDFIDYLYIGNNALIRDIYTLQYFLTCLIFSYVLLRNSNDFTDEKNQLPQHLSEPIQCREQ